jgi:hypothetical protein
MPLKMKQRPTKHHAALKVCDGKGVLYPNPSYLKMIFADTLMMLNMFCTKLMNRMKYTPNGNPHPQQNWFSGFTMPFGCRRCHALLVLDLRYADFR